MQTPFEIKDSPVKLKPDDVANGSTLRLRGASLISNDAGRQQQEEFYRNRPLFVTGASGFIGSHCLAALAKLNAAISIQVNCASKDFYQSENHRQSTNHNSLHQLDVSTVNVSCGDINDFRVWRDAFAAQLSSHIFHFAALTPAHRSQPTTSAMNRANVSGTICLLRAVAQYATHARTVLFGSSAVYGQPASEAIDEDFPFAPINDYGASKAAQELSAQAYARENKLSLIRLRTFNLIGAGEPAGLVCSSLARQIAAAELGLNAPVIHVGNLAARRDFTDVRDAVQAYLLIAQYGRDGAVYNVCSSRSVAINEVLERLLSLTQIRFEVVRRAADSCAFGSHATDVRGSYERLHKLTSWQPRISLDESLQDLLAWWRKRLADELLNQKPNDVTAKERAL